MWCILAGLHPVQPHDHPQSVEKYRPFQNELNMNGIENFVSIQDIPKFEKQNPGISVNVLSF